MSVNSPEFLYIGFILPILFSLSLIGEGFYKISQKEEGFFTLVLGIFSLISIVFGYFFIINKFH